MGAGDSWATVHRLPGSTDMTFVPDVRYESDGAHVGTDPMAEGLVWQLLLRVPPHQVFAALVRATTRRGRLHEIEDYGTTLTFTPTRGAFEHGRRLRAHVGRHGEETLLQIGAVDPHAGGCDTTREAELIRELIGELRDRVAQLATQAPVA
jgi:hypothetical protein